MAYTSIFNTRYGEQRWVAQTTEFFQGNRSWSSHAVRIFRVPETLRAGKPEAYTPQEIGLGPYHHLRAELYEERGHRKLDTAQMVLDKGTISFQDLIVDLKALEHSIRACYDPLDIEGDALALIIAIDCLYFYDFLCKFARGLKSVEDRMNGDVLMLENQIPLFLLKTVSDTNGRSLLDINKRSLFDGSVEEGTSSDNELAFATEAYYVNTSLLSSRLMRYCMELSPLRCEMIFTHDRVFYSDHLLGLMYHLLVPPKMVLKMGFSEIAQTTASLVSLLFNCPGAQHLANLLQAINNLPWERIYGLLRLLNGSKSSTPEDDNPPLLPSVSQLCGAGLEFIRLDRPISYIEFESWQGTLHLPVITLSRTSEVVLRNLLAYEAITVPSWRLPLASYMDLINGIIHTTKDAKLLREKGIVRGTLSDSDVVELFKGISTNCIRKEGNSSDSKVVVEQVNQYYNNNWKVKARKLLKKLFGFLMLFFTVLMVLLLSLHSFCEVYGCNSLFRETVVLAITGQAQSTANS